MKPSFIVLYEPDLSFIRQIEVYHAERVAASMAKHESAGGSMTQHEAAAQDSAPGPSAPGRTSDPHTELEAKEREEKGGGGDDLGDEGISRPRLVVHHLTYAAKGSLEGQAHLSNVEREKKAMASLIDFKQHLVIQQGLPHGSVMPSWTPGEEEEGGGAGDIYSRNKLTRRAGGASALSSALATPVSRPTVIIDMREFNGGNNALPPALHKKGVRIIPVTLEVGDYILSPEICIERKAIPDLHSSLASGRLFSQAESMCKHYKTPILLIEFHPEKQFSLVSQRDISDSIESKSVISRLSLLILHFPRLRIIWSRSPHATAEIFMALKTKNQDEPDPSAAALQGLQNILGINPIVPASNSSVGGSNNAPGSTLALPSSSSSPSAAAVREWLVNEPAQALLRRLPGVTEGNVRGLMSELGSLKGVADASLEELQRIMGGGKNAQVLFDFLHT